MKKQFVSLVLVLCLGLANPALAAGQTFRDVPAQHWANEAITFVVEKGLFQGTSATTFAPEATMTRAMLLQVLYRYAGSPAVSGTVAQATPFRDVPSGAYYADAVVWAYQNKLFPNWYLHYDFYQRDAAHTRTQFSPDQVVPRFDLAVILEQFSKKFLDDAFNTMNEYFQYVGRPTLFQDMGEIDMLKAMNQIYDDYTLSDDDFLKASCAMICWAYPQGILTGTAKDTMSPAASVTRAQIAAILMRHYRIYIDGADAVPPAAEDYSLQIAVGETTIAEGGVSAIAAYTSGEGGRDVTFQCVSSHPAVVSVTPVDSGAAGGKWELAGIAPGTAVITVRDSNGKTATATITVTAVQRPEPTPSPESGSNQAFIDEVVRLVNEERTARGLSALQTTESVMAAAQIRAEELPQLMEHTRPDGRSFFTVLDEVGVRYQTAGENIAGGQTTPEQVVTAWMNSDGHRANILNGSFTAIGVGYYHLESGWGHCWVQLFIG